MSLWDTVRDTMFLLFALYLGLVFICTYTNSKNEQASLASCWLGAVIGLYIFAFFSTGIGMSIFVNSIFFLGAICYVNAVRNEKATDNRRIDNINWQLRDHETLEQEHANLQKRNGELQEALSLKETQRFNWQEKCRALDLQYRGNISRGEYQHQKELARDWEMAYNKVKDGKEVQAERKKVETSEKAIAKKDEDIAVRKWQYKTACETMTRQRKEIQDLKKEKTDLKERIDRQAPMDLETHKKIHGFGALVTTIHNMSDQGGDSLVAALLLVEQLLVAGIDFQLLEINLGKLAMFRSCLRNELALPAPGYLVGGFRGKQFPIFEDAATRDWLKFITSEGGIVHDVAVTPVPTPSHLFQLGQVSTTNFTSTTSTSWVTTTTGTVSSGNPSNGRETFTQPTSQPNPWNPTSTFTIKDQASGQTAPQSNSTKPSNEFTIKGAATGKTTQQPNGVIPFAIKGAAAGQSSSQTSAPTVPFPTGTSNLPNATTQKLTVAPSPNATATPSSGNEQEKKQREEKAKRIAERAKVKMEAAQASNLLATVGKTTSPLAPSPLGQPPMTNAPGQSVLENASLVYTSGGGIFDHLRKPGQTAAPTTLFGGSTATVAPSPFANSDRPRSIPLSSPNSIWGASTNSGIKKSSQPSRKM